MSTTMSANGSSSSSISAFCAEQRELLELELRSERDEASSKPSASSTSVGASKTVASLAGVQEGGVRSQVLHRLEVSDVSVGLYGRTVARFVAAASAAVAPSAEKTKNGDRQQANCSVSESRLLPAHRFTTGDEVEIRSKNSGGGGSGGNGNNPAGVVSEVTDTSICVALFPTKARKKQQQQQKNNNGAEAGEDGEEDPLGRPPYSLIPRSSIEVHRKLVAALSELEKHGSDHVVSGRVVRALFEAPTSSEASRPSPSTTATMNPFNARLDMSQLEAIEFALNGDHSRPVSLIHGPPGTGKTTTVVELIRQAVLLRGYKVLVAAPSNVAVDNVLERLVIEPESEALVSGGGGNNKRSGGRKKGRASDDEHRPHRVRVVRLGHPARLRASILPYSLEAMVQSAEGTEIVSDARSELRSFLRVLSDPKSRANDKRTAYREVKALRKEVRTREERVVRELIDSSQVVLSTCVGAANPVLRDCRFDLVVVDEAAQALEAACWIPALRGARLVLAGDHCQLPPTIQCPEARVQRGLGRTMFERLMELYGDDSNKKKKDDVKKKNKEHGSDSSKGRISRMLRVQYRMHLSIADWASQALYGGELQTHESVSSRTLKQLTRTTAASDGDGNDDDDGVSGNDDNYDDSAAETALLLVDTAGCDMHESTDGAGSRYNEGEVQIVSRHVRALLDIGVRQDQVAVITPYNGQVERLRSALLSDAPRLEIRSVDGFQGGEREAVVLSLVRSSDRGGRDGIGFLRDDRRLNVAVTRAKRHMCLVCDSETVSQSPFVKNLIDWIEDNGDHRSAVEYLSSSSREYDDQVAGDLLHAETELRRIMEEQQSDNSGQKTTTGALPPTVSSTKKGSTSTRHVKPRDEEKRKELMEKIRHFKDTGRPGQVMALSTELSKFDRKLVHEVAEDLGLEHRSEGVEGVDRRITLTIPPIPVTVDEDRLVSSAVDSAPDPGRSIKDGKEERDGTVNSTTVSAPASGAPSFDALRTDETDDDDDDDDGGESDHDHDTKKQMDVDVAIPVVEPGMNTLLGNLAKERAQRERQKQRESSYKSSSNQPTIGGKKNKSGKKKGQKLGGSDARIRQQQRQQRDDDDRLNNIEDDMAFLDAQVAKVQNSHGRKIEGTGSNYRKIVSGYLVSTPREDHDARKKRDPRASAALQTKLKQAQDDRKAKSKPKKRR